MDFPKLTELLKAGDKPMDPRTKKSKKNGPKEDEVVEEVKKTELGDFLLKYKSLMIGLGVALSLVLIAIPMINNNKEKAKDELAEVLFEFKDKSLDAYKEDKLDEKAFTAKVAEFQTKHGDEEQAISIFLEIAQSYLEKGENAQAVAVLEKNLSLAKKKPYVEFFYLRNLAVANENLGKTDEAIGHLEKLLSSKNSIAESRISFDLARLYQKKGLVDKAIEKLESIASSDDKTDQVAKLAKILLAQLKGKK